MSEKWTVEEEINLVLLVFLYRERVGSWEKIDVFVARLLGRSVEAIAHKRQEIGRKLRKFEKEHMPRNQDTVKQVVEMRRKGYSYRVISKHLGVSQGTIAGIIRDRGRASGAMGAPETGRQVT